MSYILQALAKKTQQEDPNTGSQHSSASAVPANVHHHVVPVDRPSNNAFSWGLLLTVAILSSLLIGYWLGQQSVFRPSHAINQLNAEPASVNHITESQPSANKLNEADQPIPTNTAENKPTSVQTTNEKAVDKISAITEVAPKIAAESYFEQPPQPVVDSGVKNAEKIETVTLAKAAKVAEEESKNFTIKPIEGVSDKLLAKFQSAIESTEQEGAGVNDSSLNNRQTSQQQVRPLTDMPAWVQNGVPKLSFDMHIYASDGNGWVKVNGEEKYEHQKIAENLTLEEILPQKVILNYQGERFSLPALTDW